MRALYVYVSGMCMSLSDAHVCIHVCMYVYTHVHTHVRTHTHSHTHTAQAQGRGYGLLSKLHKLNVYMKLCKQSVRAGAQGGSLGLHLTSSCL